jgi:two-component system, sensor histidine kinase and response regulator
MASSLTKRKKKQSTDRARAPGASVEACVVPDHGRPASRQANILIVDDRQDKRLAMETIIADLNQNIVQASSGREALRHLLNMEFAVILLDVNMPGMDGFETAVLIRERKSLENVPIIFVSAVSDTETHVSRGYSLGAVDYILAPIVPEILRAKVAVFVELYKITEQVRRQAQDLRLAHSELEMRVKQRTAELAVSNEALQMEIREREHAEESLRQLNLKLEERVSERTAELRTANQELEAFSYSIAHDLRAPFRQIHGYVELLQEEFAAYLPPEAQNYLKRIGSKSREMGQMVDDLLNLFGVVRQKFDFAVVDLNDLIKDVIANTQEAVPDRRIVWNIGDLPTLKCNYGLVKQVFDNLVSNAVKYTRPRNPAHIEIGCSRTEQEDIIFIRDDGVGFDMRSMERLFGVFQRLHRAEDFEGTGVGLALTSRIIRKHGGRIWAEGKVGQGATFYFTLGKR